PVDGEDEVLVAVAAVRERRRRVRHDLGREAGRGLQPRGDVARRREDPLRLAERSALELQHLPAQGAVAGALRELAELGAVEIPRLPELMEEPDDLVRMPHGVRRELRRDDELDRPAVRLLEVEQPPEERLRQDALARIP